MYTVMGITGQIGGVVGQVLLAANQQVRAVVRDADKGRAWADRGCEVAQATIEDAASLTTAFRGAEGVFVLVPSSFDPTPGFPEARTIGVTLRAARGSGVSGASRLPLYDWGAATRSNLLNQHTIIEEALGTLPTPITFLRPAWFMENCSWDVASARAQGVIPSFLQPLDKPLPMVATADIGRVAAGLLQEKWSGRRVVELEGPQRVAPNEIASRLAKLLVVRYGWRPCRANPGRVSSSRRARRTRCLACRCWMALTKAGSSSRTGKQVRRREALPWRAF